MMITEYMMRICNNIIVNMYLTFFSHFEYSDYCLYIHCYSHNVSADISLDQGVSNKRYFPGYVAQHPTFLSNINKSCISPNYIKYIWSIQVALHTKKIKN